MLVLLTDETFGLERAYEQGQGEIWPLAREVVAPLALGLAFWSADDPLLAATLIDKALQVEGLSLEEQLALREQLAAAMLALGRADLAEEQLAATRGMAESACLVATSGTVAMMRREWDDAEAEFLRAINTDPSFVPAYCGLSSVLAIKLTPTAPYRRRSRRLGLMTG